MFLLEPHGETVKDNRAKAGPQHHLERPECGDHTCKQRLHTTLNSSPFPETTGPQIHCYATLNCCSLLGNNATTLSGLIIYYCYYYYICYKGAKATAQYCKMNSRFLFQHCVQTFERSVYTYYISQLAALCALCFILRGCGRIN